MPAALSLRMSLSGPLRVIQHRRNSARLGARHADCRADEPAGSATISRLFQRRCSGLSSHSLHGPTNVSRSSGFSELHVPMKEDQSGGFAGESPGQAQPVRVGTLPPRLRARATRPGTSSPGSESVVSRNGGLPQFVHAGS